MTKTEGDISGPGIRSEVVAINSSATLGHPIRVECDGTTVRLTQPHPEGMTGRIDVPVATWSDLNACVVRMAAEIRDNQKRQEQ